MQKHSFLPSGRGPWAAAKIFLFITFIIRLCITVIPFPEIHFSGVWYKGKAKMKNPERGLRVKRQNSEVNRLFDG